jgi:two-component system sensor histidine kinase PilS (NtrC family)
MDIVLREVDRLNGLITELLDYARPRELVKTRVELAPLVSETIRFFGQGKALPATVAYAANAAPVVDADAGQIRQVLFNLLRNAAEAMPAGGEIAVELGQEGSDAIIAVRDRGEGIPADQQERVFEPFFTTKSGGTGLGLPTVHRIVTEHGGSVVVDSPPGRGTTLTVRLPVAA